MADETNQTVSVTDIKQDAATVMEADEHFVIDFHPESDRVVMASPCSGHGFKHSAAIGEILCQLALDKESKIDIKEFALQRPALASC